MLIRSFLLLLPAFLREILRPGKKFLTEIQIVIIQMLWNLCQKKFKIFVGFQSIRLSSFCDTVDDCAGSGSIVVNARHMKAVPGRKTDVKDAEWIADLLQHGLLQPSYIPDKDQRELRELVRYRKSLVGERTRELNRLQKMLEGANIKLSGTVSDINGKSARSIVNGK